MSSDKGKIGSTFDDFLKQEGLYEEASTVAAKRVLAWQLKQKMEQEAVTKQDMAKRLNTSRSQLDRILDPDNDRVQLDTLENAAKTLGYGMRIELVRLEA